jgi:small nuclear ribonucleoprotein (snRNP)-like protein
MDSENVPVQHTTGQVQPQERGEREQNAKRLPNINLPRFLGTGRVHSRRLDRKDKTLSFFPLTLQGSAVVLELRNSVFLRGMLYMADIHMKCVLHSAIPATVQQPIPCLPPQQKTVPFCSMFLSKVKVIREGVRLCR